ncbi:MAG: hypothetical protein ACJA11_003367 [Glaciecola sp.]|jgi:hypothetical protein
MTNFQRTTSTGLNSKTMTKPSNEKRPKDWTKDQRFNAIMACHALFTEEISAYCRSQGIYSHYLDQWKLDFLGNNNEPVMSALKIRQLSKQNQKLQRELTRKDKALAETAAL